MPITKEKEIVKDGLGSRYRASYTHEITCPWCLYEYSNSWENSSWIDEEVCSECHKKFSVDRNIEVTYTTKRIKEPKK
jgi:hypothetical protein